MKLLSFLALTATIVSYGFAQSSSIYDILYDNVATTSAYVTSFTSNAYATTTILITSKCMAAPVLPIPTNLHCGVYGSLNMPHIVGSAVLPLYGGCADKCMSTGNCRSISYDIGTAQCLLLGRSLSEQGHYEASENRGVVYFNRHCFTCAGSPIANTGMVINITLTNTTNPNNTIPASNMSSSVNSLSNTSVLNNTSTLSSPSTFSNLGALNNATISSSTSSSSNTSIPSIASSSSNAHISSSANSSSNTNAPFHASPSHTSTSSVFRNTDFSETHDTFGVLSSTSSLAGTSVVSSFVNSRNMKREPLSSLRWTTQPSASSVLKRSPISGNEL